VALGTKTDEGAASATGSFTSSITGLSANTTYYVCAYATNTAGTSYGEQVSFTTTAPIVAFNTTSSNGSETIDGGATKTFEGVLTVTYETTEGWW
jgi:hypothetical protein